MLSTLSSTLRVLMMPRKCRELVAIVDVEIARAKDQGISEVFIPSEMILSLRVSESNLDIVDNHFRRDGYNVSICDDYKYAHKALDMVIAWD